VRRSINERVIGFVRREKLTTGLVRNHIEEITEDALVDESIGIAHLLPRLKDRAFVFVCVNNQLNGILTFADLNKPLVRVYFFGLISLLEIHMSFWVAQEDPDATWKEKLTQSRIDAAMRTQADRRERGQMLELVDCLQFADKRDLVLGSDHLRDRLALGSKTNARKRLRDAEDLRNTLAHSQYDLVQGSTWSSLIDLFQWISTLISKSDAAVEDHAIQMARGHIGALW
jgi:hypothetical protein